MSVAHLTTSVGAVMSERGEQFRARRTAIGMSVSALAKRAGVDRGSLAALEEGRGVRDTTVAQIEKTLADLEHELGMDVPSIVESPAAPDAPSEPLRFTFRDIYGIGEIVAEGGDSEELLLAVRKLLADIRPTTPKD